MEKRFEGQDARLDRMVPIDAWNRENDYTRERFAEQDRDCRERTTATEKAVDERFKQRDQRGEKSWTRVLAIAGIAATLVAALIGVYATTKGIK